MKNEQNWQNKYEKLLSFQVKFGCVAPTSDENLTLLSWYYRNRNYFELGSLSEERQKLWKQLPAHLKKVF